MKALRSFYQRKKHFPLLRQAAVLFFCISAFTFPLFGDEQEDLTNALKKAIPKYSSDKMDIEEIGRLLDAGADPNGFYRKEYQESFLYHAAESGNVQLTRILLEHGADPNLGHTDGTWSRSPPVFYGNRQITALFIKHGARFDVFEDRSKMSPLFYQVANNVSSALLVLEWEQQHSPDFCAHYKNRKEYLTATLARLLLQKGGFSNRARDEIYVMVERLIDGGADPAAPTEDGVPVAYLAVSIYDRPHFIIPLLIEKGAPVDAFNGDGETALYCAVYNEDLVLSDFLLKKGADINQQNKFSKGKLMPTTGETALMTAKSEEMMRFLLEHGANPNLQDKDGETALMKYYARTKEPLTKLLLKHGADPAIKNKEGRTVLFYWLGRLDGPMLDELISRGCKIDEPDNEGNTPLIYAARYKDDRETVLILLEKGADPNYRNAKGRTALHACLLSIKESWPWYKDDDMKRDMRVITALLEAGTRPTDKDDDGDTALAAALRLPGMDRKMAPIGKLVRQYADAEDIKIAAAAARKEKKEDTREMLSEYLPPTIAALSVPLILGGISFLMREVAFKDNPSGNIMGPVNAALTLGGGGFFLGFLMGGQAGEGLGAIATGFVGGLLGGVAGIIVACIPSVFTAFNNNSVLYYAPAVISAVVASVVIFKIWF